MPSLSRRRTNPHPLHSPLWFETAHVDELCRELDRVTTRTPATGSLWARLCRELTARTHPRADDVGSLVLVASGQVAHVNFAERSVAVLPAENCGQYFPGNAPPTDEVWWSWAYRRISGAWLPALADIVAQPQDMRARRRVPAVHLMRAFTRPRKDEPADWIG